MKRVATFLFVFVLAGCPTLQQVQLDSPELKLAAAKVAYSQALVGVTAAWEAGDISDDTFINKVVPATKAVRAAINEAEQAISLKDPDVLVYLEAITRNLELLTNLYEVFK